jgi:hypothetical protein
VETANEQTQKGPVAVLHRTTACPCGQAVAIASTGRPRRYCSERCRRAADFRRRKQRRLEDALAAWRSIAPGDPMYPRSRVRREIRQLRAELDELYPASAFVDAIARYLPSKPSKRQNANSDGPESPISMCQADESVDALKTADQGRIHCPADGLTVRSGDPQDVAAADGDVDDDANGDHRRHY